MTDKHEPVTITIPGIGTVALAGLEPWLRNRLMLQVRRILYERGVGSS